MSKTKKETDQRDKVDTRLFIDEQISDLLNLAHTSFDIEGLRYVRREIDRKVANIEVGKYVN